MSEPQSNDLTNSQSSVDSSSLPSLESFDTLSSTLCLSSTSNQCSTLSTSNSVQFSPIVGKKRARDSSFALPSNVAAASTSSSYDLPTNTIDVLSSFRPLKRVHFSNKCRVRRIEAAVSEDEDMKAEAKEFVITSKGATSATTAAASFQHAASIENSTGLLAASKITLHSKAPSSRRQKKLLAAAAKALKNIQAQWSGHQLIRQQSFRPPPEIWTDCELAELDEAEAEKAEERARAASTAAAEAYKAAAAANELTFTDQSAEDTLTAEQYP